MAKTRRFEMRMDEDLLGAVDAERGSVSRAAFIVAAVRRALAGDEPVVSPSASPQLSARQLRERATSARAPERQSLKEQRDARVAARRMPSPSLERFRS